MARYATVRSFSGQRASVGRVVVIRDHIGLFAGMIHNIDDQADQPTLVPVMGGGETTARGLAFFEAKTEADLAEMPVDSWTWPPRV